MFVSSDLLGRVEVSFKTFHMSRILDTSKHNKTECLFKSSVSQNGVFGANLNESNQDSVEASSVFW